jgi:hypothetical protein
MKGKEHESTLRGDASGCGDDELSVWLGVTNCCIGISEPANPDAGHARNADHASHPFRNSFN